MEDELDLSDFTNLEILELDGNDKLSKTLEPYEDDWKFYQKDLQESNEDNQELQQLSIKKIEIVQLEKQLSNLQNQEQQQVQVAQIIQLPSKIN